MHELFRPSELIEITQGPFKGFIGFFEKLQTLPDGLSRAMLLVEILGSVQKAANSLATIKKNGRLIFYVPATFIFTAFVSIFYS